jgi:uncharacterized iron-regulated membrane protein
MRNAIRQIHLCIGVLSGIVIFTVGVTGATYAFEKELRDIIHRDLYFITAKSSLVSMDSVLASAKSACPGQTIKNIVVPENKKETIQITFKNKIVVFVDPYTGLLIGRLDMNREFLAVVLEIHRSLCAGETGKMITGISALLFLTMLISGLLLWWPNKKNRKQKFKVNNKFGAARLIHDLHSVLGFYASWILIFSITTGIIFSFKWAEGILYAMSNSKKAEKQIISSSGQMGAHALDTMLLKLKREFPAHQYVIALPEDSTGAVRAMISKGKKGIRRVHQVFFDQFNGIEIKQRYFEDAPAGEQLRINNYQVHTGKIIGLPGQLLVFIGALIAASLPVTGLLWWRRKR